MKKIINLTEKYDLSDVTFVIPFMIDHPDRIENLEYILKFLSNNFSTNVIVIEAFEIDKLDEKSYDYTKFQKLFKSFTCYGEETVNNIFWRTKLINEGIKRSKTTYFSIYDADVIFNPSQIIAAVESLREGFTLSYPYNGNFIDINRSIIKDDIIIEKESFTMESVGGACFLNRENYIKCGLENEFFYGWCPDDVERLVRVKKLGYTVSYKEGVCWHINHWRGANSGPNKYTEQNLKEYEKIKSLSKEQLKNYIETWEWAQK